MRDASFLEYARGTKFLYDSFIKPKTTTDHFVIIPTQ
jgi:hypothetical protein